MEPTAAKTVFTRRRLFASSVLIVIALALSVVLWWPQGVSVANLTVKFVRFDASSDGGTDYAILNVRNESPREWMLPGAREWMSLKDTNLFQARGRFTTARAKSESGRVVRNHIGGGGGVVQRLETNQVEQIAVPLPQSGEKGWVEIFCWTPPQVRRGWPGVVQQLSWRVRPPNSLWAWVRCEVPIQCGIERPYGKPVPPRLLSPDGITHTAPP
jgi:hypothetical protein